MTTSTNPAPSRWKLAPLGIGIALFALSLISLFSINTPADVSPPILNASALRVIAAGVIVVGISAAVLSAHARSAGISGAVSALAIASNSASVGMMLAILPGLLRPPS